MSILCPDKITVIYTVSMKFHQRRQDCDQKFA